MKARNPSTGIIRQSIFLKSVMDPGEGRFQSVESAKRSSETPTSLGPMRRRKGISGGGRGCMSVRIRALYTRSRLRGQGPAKVYASPEFTLDHVKAKVATNHRMHIQTVPATIDQIRLCALEAYIISIVIQ